MRTWHRLVCLVVILVVAGCSEDRPTLTDYVEGINEIVAEGREQAEAEYLAYRSIPNPSVDDTRRLLENEVDIRRDVQGALVGLDPPELVTDLHIALLDWHAQVIEAEEELITRAATAVDWTELAGSEESRAYDTVLGEGLAACRELQADLDAAAARGGFADTPWVPRSLMEAVAAMLQCDTPLTG